MITFGAIYALVPWLWKRETMYSPRLVEVHFWLALSGTIIYVFAMWNSGIIQGLMWRTYNEGGTLAIFLPRKPSSRCIPITSPAPSAGCSS
jgi:cytochrome c oxidase cbb3-type subunit 1